jgi:hypothetical protein
MRSLPTRNHVTQVEATMHAPNAQSPWGKRRWRQTLCMTLPILLFWVFPIRAQQAKYADEATFDDKGNIFVSSEGRKLIWMADTRHCSEVREAEDRQTFGCLVSAQLQATRTEGPPPTLQLEIYLHGGRKNVIEPGQPILEWHFWKKGQQVSVYSGLRDGQGTHTLYESATGGVLETFAQPTDESLLPQWAKGPAQIADESVSMSATFSEERTKWVSKMLRQISRIEPGMRRKDLLTVFTTEGGLSNRFQRTYVYIECPYIKVNVKFKPANNERDALQENQEDIIESISQPYLARSVAD